MSVEYKLCEEQLRVYDRIEDTNCNYFITGKAGTGKSVLLRYFIENTKKKVAVLAPTGIAAINVGGQTIHSFFGLKPSLQNPYDAGKISENKIKLLKNIDTLVIDEISMVRSDVMNMIDLKLRIARGCSDKVFGGCQVIAFGDLFQLAPVIDKDEIVREYIYDNFGSEFFFATKGISENPFNIVELNKVHRQTDERFINILNDVRIGKVDNTLLNTINSRQTADLSHESYITLTPTRVAADLVNREKLGQLKTKEYTFVGEIVGDFNEEDLPTDIELKLKVGAQVIMLRNDASKRWINGTIAVICEISDDYIKIDINGIKYPVNRDVWNKYQYVYDEEKRVITQKQIGSFKQFPIQLAYAITIHKSQGQTYEKVLIDYSVGRAFAAGQTYVALSRCRKFNDLYISGDILHDDIKVNQEIVNYFNGNFHHEFKNVSIEDIKKNSSKNNIGIKWLANNRIGIDSPSIKPKKITGTRFPAVLGYDKYKNPFTIWCALTHVFEEEFKGNKFTDAGKTIEPKQIEYIKKLYTTNSTCVLSPDDKYGDNAKESMGYDFFKENEVFGGMWDAILQENRETKAVFELKTVSEKKRREWESEIPRNYKLQVSLYAWLLGIDNVHIVVSFLVGQDYNCPSAYMCNNYNTKVFSFNIYNEYPNFERDYIKPAIKWWNNYIESGISPQYDKEKDKNIIESLK